MGSLERLPVTNREGGMTSSQHAPPAWATRATMAKTKSREFAKSANLINLISSDCRLQLAYPEVGIAVIAGQPWRESVPGPCTHRPSHHGSWSSRNRLLNLWRAF